MAIAFDSAVTFEKSSIKDNTAGFFGGGLFNADSVTTLRDHEVVANRALGPIGVGGGIFNIFGAGQPAGRRSPTTSPPSPRAVSSALRGT